MNVAETIFSINSTVQSYFAKRGERTISADDAARLVYEAGIISPDAGPPDAQGFAFRQFLRGLRDEYGHDVLFLLLGVRQSRNQPQGKYVLYIRDAPSLENIKELLSISRNKINSEENQVPEGRIHYPIILRSDWMLYRGNFRWQESAEATTRLPLQTGSGIW
jgi:hypothetical protein